LGSFTPEELAIAHQHLNPGKSLDLDSIYRVYTPLKSWFCDFLPSTKNSKDLEKSTNSCDPQAGKATGRPK